MAGVSYSATMPAPMVPCFSFIVASRALLHSDCHCDYSPFFILSVNLSSPDNKKDKAKSAKAQPISNSSLSETNEGINISLLTLGIVFVIVFIFLEEHSRPSVNVSYIT